MYKPSTTELVSEVTRKIETHQGYPDLDEANRWYRLAKYIRKARPEKDWLIGMLCALDQNNEIFRKGAQPPNRPGR